MYTNREQRRIESRKLTLRVKKKPSKTAETLRHRLKLGWRVEKPLGLAAGKLLSWNAAGADTLLLLVLLSKRSLYRVGLLSGSWSCVLARLPSRLTRYMEPMPSSLFPLSLCLSACVSVCLSAIAVGVLQQYTYFFAFQDRSKGGRKMEIVQLGIPSSLVITRRSRYNPSFAANRGQWNAQGSDGELVRVCLSRWRGSERPAGDCTVEKPLERSVALFHRRAVGAICGESRGSLAPVQAAVLEWYVISCRYFTLGLEEPLALEGLGSSVHHSPTHLCNNYCRS